MQYFDRENILRFCGWKVWSAKLNLPKNIFWTQRFSHFFKDLRNFFSVADINLEKSFRPIHEFERNSDAKQELCL